MTCHWIHLLLMASGYPKHAVLRGRQLGMSDSLGSRSFGSHKAVLLRRSVA
jgi:hypothetical protein